MLATDAIRDDCSRIGSLGRRADLALRGLEGLGMVREVTGRQRRRIYFYERCVEILREGTDERPG